MPLVRADGQAGGFGIACRRACQLERIKVSLRCGVLLVASEHIRVVHTISVCRGQRRIEDCLRHVETVRVHATSGPVHFELLTAVGQVGSPRLSAMCHLSLALHGNLLSFVSLAYVLIMYLVTFTTRFPALHKVDVFA